MKILDCSQIIAGPFAGSLLSEMGADVVKVEPLEGEPWRLQAEIIPKESRTYVVQNRGKRGVTVDFKAPAAAPVREALIRWADVLIVNYRPGAAKQLGLDYESARAIRPDIIYCETTAFGKAGPDALRRGYDIVAQAMSGLMASNGIVQNGRPVVSQHAPADYLTGALIAWGITAALYHRERTGEGQAIDTSLLSTALTLQGQFREIVALDEEILQRRLEVLRDARARGATYEQVVADRQATMPELSGNIYYRTYLTKDGAVAVGCLGPGPRERFRRALAIHDPRYEPGFVAEPGELAKIGSALVEECEARFRDRTTDEWVRYLDENDVAAGPVRFVDELWQEPQVQANGYVVEYEHTLLGQMRGAAPPVRMSATPTAVTRSSPALGEHTDEVLRQLGFPTEQIDAWRAARVIG